MTTTPADSPADSPARVPGDIPAHPADAGDGGQGALFGNRFITQEVPTRYFPDDGMSATDAMRLVALDVALEGEPIRNLATFVTTWMEPEAQRIIAANLHRNFIDHAEYPRTAEIEQRCIRMLSDLFHAPGETTGARTQGSSEAIMLGALSLKWNWRKRRESRGEPSTHPNLVFGHDVHVVWEKFCRYFDVEPRIVPLQKGKYTIGPDDVLPHVDEDTIGVAAVLGTTFTGHRDDIVGINDMLVHLKADRGLDVPLHVDAASGGFVWPFLYPDSAWDFRLEQVRSINVSGHKFGLVYPGIGWLVFRDKSDLAQDLVFEENYLGKTDATFTLNFSTGSAMVLAQYYNLIRYGRAGYTYIMRNMQDNARMLAEKLDAMGRFELIGPEEEQLPLVAFRLAKDEVYDEFDIAWQLSAERGWMVPAYTLPPDAQDLTIMRALVKQTFSREHVDTLARDIEEACTTLGRKGRVHESERRQVLTGPGH
jgi:glutamate decarboxylase